MINEEIIEDLMRNFDPYKGEYEEKYRLILEELNIDPRQNPFEITKEILIKWEEYRKEKSVPTS